MAEQIDEIHFIITKLELNRLMQATILRQANTSRDFFSPEKIFNQITFQRKDYLLVDFKGTKIWLNADGMKTEQSAATFLNDGSIERCTSEPFPAQRAQSFVENTELDEKGQIQDGFKLGGSVESTGEPVTIAPPPAEPIMENGEITFTDQLEASDQFTELPLSNDCRAISQHDVHEGRPFSSAGVLFVSSQRIQNQTSLRKSASPQPYSKPQTKRKKYYRSLKEIEAAKDKDVKAKWAAERDRILRQRKEQRLRKVMESSGDAALGTEYEQLNTMPSRARSEPSEEFLSPLFAASMSTMPTNHDYLTSQTLVKPLPNKISDSGYNHNNAQQFFDSMNGFQENKQLEARIIKGHHTTPSPPQLSTASTETKKEQVQRQQEKIKELQQQLQEHLHNNQIHSYRTVRRMPRAKKSDNHTGVEATIKPQEYYNQIFMNLIGAGSLNEDTPPEQATEILRRGYLRLCYLNTNNKIMFKNRVHKFVLSHAKSEESVRNNAIESATISYERFMNQSTLDFGEICKCFRNCYRRYVPTQQDGMQQVQTFSSFADVANDLHQRPELMNTDSAGFIPSPEQQLEQHEQFHQEQHLQAHLQPESLHQPDQEQQPQLQTELQQQPLLRFNQFSENKPEGFYSQEETTHQEFIGGEYGQSTHQEYIPIDEFL